MADGTPRAPVAFQVQAAKPLYIIDARNMELAGSGDEPLTVAKLREVLRQELHTA